MCMDQSSGALGSAGTRIGRGDSFEKKSSSSSRKKRKKAEKRQRKKAERSRKKRSKRKSKSKDRKASRKRKRDASSSSSSSSSSSDPSRASGDGDDDDGRRESERRLVSSLRQGENASASRGNLERVIQEGHPSGKRTRGVDEHPPSLARKEAVACVPGRPQPTSIPGLAPPIDPSALAKSTIGCGASFLGGSRGGVVTTGTTPPVIGPSLPSDNATAGLEADAEECPSIDPMARVDLPAAFALKVAVGLKQEVVNISVGPHTTWDAAKELACVAAGGLDKNAHRLLFRGRDRHPDETMEGLGVKPSTKLLLIETEESKQTKARMASEAQMEEARLARQQQFAQQQQRRKVGATPDPGPTPSPPPRPPADPVERTKSDVAACEAKVNDLQRELQDLERRTNACSGVAGAIGGTTPPKEQEYLYMSDRLEKTLISLDGVETHGMEDLRALRKAAVRRIQALLQRADAAKAAADRARR